MSILRFSQKVTCMAKKDEVEAVIHISFLANFHLLSINSMGTFPNVLESKLQKSKCHKLIHFTL